MDTEPVGFEDFRACLKDLAFVNTVTLARAPTLAWLRHATRDMRRGERLSVLDVGFGYGDMLRAIYRWCVSQGFEPDLTGIDLNPWSVASAQEATPSAYQIAYRTGDVFAFEPKGLQFSVSSQFTHHLSDADATQFVAWMEQAAGRGWFISDLHRHPVPYHVFKAMARIARWHRFVQHDGPVSIARSFRRADWERIAAAGGVGPESISIQWHFPFRLCVSRTR
jgi:2-polyprenyl-3-methyl-5-hydroxy-6-metoxy-1,4-benzoquinol methylase